MSSLYQPHYHFFPREGWINDPNGLVYFEGEYHLFYQYLWPRHWGHAISRDLIHWEYLPIALAPDELGDIWSGSAVVDTHDSSGFFGGKAGLVAIFTHHNDNVPPLGPQVQSIAYSADRGRTWTKYAGNPVIPNPGSPDFRDPRVFWYEPGKTWVMIVVARDRIHIYHAPDLKAWRLVSEFGARHGAHKGIWECPDLFELAVDGDEQHKKWVLQISLCDASYPYMQYFIGDFDGTTFTSEYAGERILWTEWGYDHYAAVSWSDIPATDGRRIWLGWMNNWRYADKVPTLPWQGMMTVPRTLHLQTFPDGPRLVQRPVVELQRLRQPLLSWNGRLIADDAPVSIPVTGTSLEVIARFRLGSAQEFGLVLRKGIEQQTLVGYERESAAVFVDRTASGEGTFETSFPARHTGPVELYENDVLHLHIFLDQSSVEVFANQGETVFSELIFPASESQALALYAHEGTVELLSLDIYRLVTIW